MTLEWKFALGSDALTDPGNDGPARDLLALWQESAHPSAFAAPHTLLHLAQVAEQTGSRVLAARGLDETGRTAAFWPLFANDGRIGLLQGHFSDHATALYRPEVTVADLAPGLEQALAELPAQSLYFGNLPAFDRTCEAATQALASAGWAHRRVKANVDPVLYEAPGQDLAQRLESHVRGKSLRNYANRLARQEGYRFEVQDDDQELREWTEAFCDCHDWRWTRTDTPSEFAKPAARDAFLALLKTWADDGVLLRCSICLGDERIAFAVLLRSGDRLVYHRIAHSPAHERTSAATVLVRNIVLWMAQEGMTTLDFGIGGEAYKLRFANREERLSRVYASASRLSSTLFEAGIDALIRSSPRAERQWDRIANQWIRANLVAGLRNAHVRGKRLGERLSRSSAHETLVPDPTDEGSADVAFQASGTAHSPEAPVDSIALLEIIDASHRRSALTSADRARFYEAQHDGWRPIGRRRDGAVCEWAWLRKRSDLAPGRIELRAGLVQGDAESVAFLKDLRAYIGPDAEMVTSGGPTGSYPPSVLRAAGFEATSSRASERDPE